MPLLRDASREYYNPLDIELGTVLWFNMSGVNGKNVYQVVGGVQSVKETNLNADNDLFTPAEYFKTSTQPKKIKVDIYFGSPGGLVRPYSGNNQAEWRIPVVGGSGAIGFLQDVILAVRDDSGNAVTYSTNQSYGGDGGSTVMPINTVARDSVLPDYSSDQATGCYINVVDAHRIDGIDVAAGTFLLGAGRGMQANTSVTGAWRGGRIVTNPTTKSTGLLYGGSGIVTNGVDSYNFGMTRWPQGGTTSRQAVTPLTTADFTDMNRVWLQQALEFGKTARLQANLTTGVMVRAHRSGVVIIYKDIVE